MKIVRAKKEAPGSARMDPGDLARALARSDRRVWEVLAVVRAVDDGAHWARDAVDDIIVEVTTMPSGMELSARLGAAAAGGGGGLWRIPAVGTEVVVAIPEGRPDFMPVIVACLSTGAAPDEASTTRTILKAPDEVAVVAPAVKLGSIDAEEQLLLGTSYRLDDDLERTLFKAWVTAVSAAIAGDPVIPPPLKVAVSAATTALTTQVDLILARPDDYLSDVSTTD